MFRMPMSMLESCQRYTVKKKDGKPKSIYLIYSFKAWRMHVCRTFGREGYKNTFLTSIQLHVRISRRDTHTHTHTHRACMTWYTIMDYLIGRHYPDSSHSLGLRCHKKILDISQSQTKPAYANQLPIFAAKLLKNHRWCVSSCRANHYPTLAQ